MNLRNPLHAGDKACKRWNPTRLRNSWQTSPEVQKIGISDPTKRTHVFQKFSYKKNNCNGEHLTVYRCGGAANSHLFGFNLSQICHISCEICSSLNHRDRCLRWGQMWQMNKCLPDSFLLEDNLRL